MTFDDFFLKHDSVKAAGDDGQDGHDEAPLYGAVVRFLTTIFSRLRRGNFRYTKTVLSTFLM